MYHRIDKINSCDECEICADVCPTYQATEKALFTPFMRLKTAKRIFDGYEVSDEMTESIYNCPECGRCELVCPYEINISEIIAASRAELVRREIAPLEAHTRIVKSIMEKGNSVGGDPNRRLEWLPEGFSKRKSETLLYLGCLPSYFVQDSATSSYLILKHADIDFMILEDEGCCGVYFYDAGMRDLAEKTFKENAARFKELGIKRIITPCAGCYRCFKRYYPEVLGDVEFEVYHIVEILDELIKKGELRLERKGGEVTYHDPCRLGRKEGMYDAPREMLKECGIEINEIEENREQGMCCGAGAGIRSLYKDLSMEIAIKLLNAAPAETIVTSCPFCAFNLSYASRKKEINKKVRYITDIMLEHVTGSHEHR